MLTKPSSELDVLNLRVGELVEVRSEPEILATLDENGELESLPFMPEMVKYCGQRLTVHKVAHKLCDTIGKSGMRRMDNAVHLTGVRCDGAAHGGCQTACSIYWKEQWLRRVPEPADPREPAVDDLAAGRTLLQLVEVNAGKDPGPDGERRFSCQATELLRAAPTCLPMRELGQYVRDVRTGNAGVLTVLRTFLVGLFDRAQKYSKRVLPRKLWFREGLPWRFLKGRAVGRTPTARLDLQPGELVRIKSREEILKTLDENLLNRGMGFDVEMSRYCGQTARVVSRVDRCIDEKTGRMLHMKSPCIVLEGVVCAGAYKANCPREFVPFWREIWLERVGESP
jgi:hypothetical protein